MHAVVGVLVHSMRVTTRAGTPPPSQSPAQRSLHHYMCWQFALAGLPSGSLLSWQMDTAACMSGTEGRLCMHGHAFTLPPGCSVLHWHTAKSTPKTRHQITRPPGSLIALLQSHCCGWASPACGLSPSAQRLGHAAASCTALCTNHRIGGSLSSHGFKGLCMVSTHSNPRPPTQQRAPLLTRFPQS